MFFTAAAGAALGLPAQLSLALAPRSVTVRGSRFQAMLLASPAPWRVLDDDDAEEEEHPGPLDGEQALAGGGVDLGPVGAHVDAELGELPVEHLLLSGVRLDGVDGLDQRVVGRPGQMVVDQPVVDLGGQVVVDESADA